LTILGDEKHTTPVAGDGTDYVETLSVAAVRPGEATLSPAYVDAQDPSRGGKPFRFSSNALRIVVLGDAAAPPDPYGAMVRRLGARILRVGGWVALAGGLAIVFGIALAIVSARLRQRPKTYVTLPQARPVQPVKVADPGAEIRSLTGRLVGVRSRENAAALRRALFGFAGSRTDETLESLLARVPAGQTDLRIALRAAERATFVDEPNLQGAIEELLDAVRHMGFG
jgi:hypothetical protein